MDRRQFMLTSAAASAGLCCHGSIADTASGQRPNIVLLLTDDQRWDAMGNVNPALHTPQMDDLAARGVRFDQGFVTTSICAASRASIFSGLVERTHRYTFGTPPMAAGHTDCSYPSLLRSSGYRTGFVGKFGVATAKGAAQRMFDYFSPLNRTPYFKQMPDGGLRHVTDITADKSIEFLRGCEPAEPFCLSVSFNAPHAEDNDPAQYIWPEAMDGLYADLEIPAPDTADPAFFDALPEFLRESLNRVRWHWRFDTPEKFQRMVKGYYRMVSGVDAAIGRIRAELQQQGLAENTVIILVSDNGYFLGERGFAGKWLPYEESLRVPLIIHDPRVGRGVAGRRCDQIALNIDLAPTILEMAGVGVPESLQGRSLVPLLKSDAGQWRDAFFFEHLMEHPQIIKHEGIRTTRHKYVRYFQQTPVHEELYDLTRDPRELVNLAREASQADLLADMRQRCDTMRDRYGGPFRPHEADEPG